jgi:hypothetical protein
MSEPSWLWYLMGDRWSSWRPSRGQQKASENQDRRCYVENKTSVAIREARKGEAETSNGTCHSAKTEERRWWLFYQQPVAGFTAWVSIFTLFLMVSAVFQAWAFVQSERAEIGISDIRFAVPLTDKINGRLVIEIKNPSKTTAFIDSFGMHVDGGETVPDDAKIGIDPKMRPVVSPGIPAHVEMDIPEKIPADYIDRINGGSYHIWVILSLIWSDHFGWFGGGKSGYCFYYDPSRGRGVDSFYRCHDPRYEY